MKEKISRRDFLKTTTLAGVGVFILPRISNSFDLIIKNGSIIDGTGSKRFKADIGIIDNLIYEIGNLSHASADNIIDATGKIISPGFIDIHTHTDIELLVNPNAESKIRQGITLEVSGNCGSSPFPLTESDRESKSKYYTDRYGFGCDWNFISGFYEKLENKGMALNYASFTGHGDLRAYVVGRNDVPPTPEQLKKMKYALAQSMEQGSLGLSTGLEYSPGSYAETDELIQLCKTVSEMGGVYSTHMRNEDDTVEEAVEEAVEISRKSGVSLQISHLKACNKNNWHKVENILKSLDKYKTEGIPLMADRYPYTAYGTGLSALVPLWARQGNSNEVVSRLKNDKEFENMIPHLKSRGERIGGWDRFLISYTVNDEYKEYTGKTIQQCCEYTGKDAEQTIRQILVDNHMSAGMVGFAMDEQNTMDVLAHPLVSIGSDGSVAAPYGKLSEGSPHPRFYGTFPRVLGYYAREKGIFSLEEAVKKSSWMNAQKLGIKNRGQIAKKYFADLVIFDEHKVIDKATFEKPHQYPEGINYVIVNGTVVIKNGEHTGKLPGKIVKG
ncbi:MAG: aminoacylase [Melioribacteraceae bacterium]|nr:MAG: aminoacylase [Melioribacteraceae bacterium]